jgi:hypothetical protein
VNGKREPYLERIARNHPAWEVARTASGLCYEAVTHPTASSLHAIVATSLRELEARLDAIEPPGTANGE